MESITTTLGFYLGGRGIHSWSLLTYLLSGAALVCAGSGALNHYIERDIDCKMLDYSKIAADLVVKALLFHNITSLSVKFSGNKGFHIGIPFESFPSYINNKEVKLLFPEGVRVVNEYIKNFIKDHLKAKILDKSLLGEIKKIIPYFEKPYRETVEKLAPIIQEVSKYIPQRRERVQHIGLFGYSRQVGKSKLPRAIGFTAACYSLGIPPELIGSGRGLRKIKNQKSKIKIVEDLYLELKPALI